MRILDFLNILALVTIFCGIVTLTDWVLRRKNKSLNGESSPSNVILECARSFFPVFLIVLAIRSFFFQPYRVPTGSLEPTVMPGDMILVTQYNYGLKVPLLDQTIIAVGKPKRGQIALFRWPVNPEITFVKRVIGVPGDHISYINKTFYINGIEQKQTFIKDFSEVTPIGPVATKKYIENLDGLKHYILVNDSVSSQNFKELVVPQGMYFMIGDNRDDSDDGRSWGFVPEQNFIGRAIFVWFNVEFDPFKVQWDRIGTKLSAPILDTK